MATETEIKLRVRDSAIRVQIEALGYQISTARELEVDQLYDHPDGSLRAADQIVRLRTRGIGASDLLIAFTLSGLEESRGLCERIRQTLELRDARAGARGIAAAGDRFGRGCRPGEIARDSP